MATTGRARAPKGGSRAPPIADRAARARRVLVVGALVISALVVVHAVGGWYFSGMIHDDALDAAARRAGLERTFDVEVLALDGGAITLRDTDETARRPGVWGVAWAGGYGLISGRPSVSGGGVTRRFTVVDGTPIEVGAAVDVDVRAVPDDPVVAFGARPEVVSIEGPLGTYESWFYDGDRSTWVLLLHGNGLDPLDLAKLVPAVRSAGYPVLFVTLRNDPGAPEDPSGLLRYGDTEWEDLDAAVRFARSEGASGVIPIAPSMGGGIALTFLARTAGSDSVRGLVLDVPLVDFGRAIDSRADDTGLPVIGVPIPGTLVGTAKWFATVRFGVDWDATGHLDETDRLNVPILIFHGTADADVPISTSRDLAAARPDLVTLVEVDAAPHLGSWNVDPAGYEARLLAFLDRASR